MRPGAPAGRGDRVAEQARATVRWREAALRGQGDRRRALAGACSGAVTGRDALAHVRHRTQLTLGEQRDEVLPYDPHVRAPRLLQALAASVGETGVRPARVVIAGAAMKQAVALEPVGQARQPAALQLRLL